MYGSEGVENNRVETVEEDSGKEEGDSGLVGGVFGCGWRWRE